ncbi:unnamed protein product, partial [Rotaria socialis]
MINEYLIKPQNTRWLFAGPTSANFMKGELANA